MVTNVDLIEEELWDHYSGLPNPHWYKYKEDEKKNLESSSNDRDVVELEKTKKEHMEPKIEEEV